MISLYKNRGETPLQALDRLRTEQPELASETLSYAGRLDPMAEGVLLVLVGPEENRNRQEFLHKEKEYEATFMLGCATDTHDVLGLVTKTDFKSLNSNVIDAAVRSFVDITRQTYPWYSSRTVDGIPLFEYARKGNFDIVRPEREVRIFSAEDINTEDVNGPALVEENIRDINAVVGDFRQEEIVASWKVVDVPASVQLVSVTLHVSSGTYVRSLCEHLEAKLGVPVLLQRLVRTRVL